MAKRSYSDVDKGAALAALDANNGNVNKTAREIGIPRITLKEWNDGRVNSNVLDIRQIKKGEIAERLDDATQLLLDVLPQKLKDATLQQVATAIGILQDKAQLLKGEPTERAEMIEPLDDTTRISRIAAIFDAARDRRDRSVNPSPAD